MCTQLLAILSGFGQQYESLLLLANGSLAPSKPMLVASWIKIKIFECFSLLQYLLNIVF